MDSAALVLLDAPVTDPNCCCDQKPVRLIAPGCGTEAEVIDSVAGQPARFPLCDPEIYEGRVGDSGWESDCPTCGPYAPDIWSLSAGNNFDLFFVSTCLWRSLPVTQPRIKPWWPNGQRQQGTMTFYYELDLSSIAIYGAVVRRVTTSHPDPRFPAIIEYHNPLALTVGATVFRLVDSDAVLAFVNTRTLVPGTLNYPARGTPAAGLYGIPCEVTLGPGRPVDGIRCLSLYLDWPVAIPVLVGPGPDSRGPFSLEPRFGVFSPRGYDDRVVLEGVSLNHIGAGTHRWRYLIKWKADCAGVVVTVEAGRGVDGEGFDFVGVSGVLAHDWYKSEFRVRGNITFQPGGAVTEIDAIIGPCSGYGYYGGGGGGGEGPRCLPESRDMFVDIGNIPGQLVGGIYPLTWGYHPTLGDQWQMAGLTPPTGTGTGYQVQISLLRAENYYGVPWSGAACDPAEAEVWVLRAYVVREDTGDASSLGGVLAHICILCDPVSGQFGMVGYSLDLGAAGISSITVYDA